jgi:predicted SnoaL-like aldol condensation-catalyzing enzyme
MSDSSPERNKAIVLEAFETLFNKRDYAAAERFWSPNYIQHSAHIAPGREGLFNLVRSVPETLHYENQLIIAEGDYVIAHGRFTEWEGPPPGSPPTLFGSKTVFLKSIGTFCRTRRPKLNLSAAYPCSATHSPSDNSKHAIVLKAFDIFFTKPRR